MNNILEVKDLKKEYPSFSLKNISFSLPKGMIMGLIGENGAGKTTTIKAITNIIVDYEGDIKVFGLDLKKDTNKIMEEIGVVLDDIFYPEILTPKDINNSMKGIYKNWDEKMFFDYLDKFSLESNKTIKTFSKGMRKKLEIITAIAHHPKLLILDEPTNGLDPVARCEVIEIFQNFIENGDNSILLSSHNTVDLEHIADYITFINDGEIVLSRTSNELLEQFGIVKCNEKEFKSIAKNDYLKYKKNKYDYELLIENKKEFRKKYDIAVIDNLTIDDLMVIMIKGE